MAFREIGQDYRSVEELRQSVVKSSFWATFFGLPMRAKFHQDGQRLLHRNPCALRKRCVWVALAREGRTQWIQALTEQGRLAISLIEWRE